MSVEGQVRRVNGDIVAEEFSEFVIGRSGDMSEAGPEHPVVNDQKICMGSHRSINCSTREVDGGCDAMDFGFVFELEPIQRQRIVWCSCRLEESVEVSGDLTNVGHELAGICVENRGISV